MQISEATSRRWLGSQSLWRRLILLGAGTFLVYATGHFLYHYFAFTDRLIRVIHYL